LRDVEVEREVECPCGAYSRTIGAIANGIAIYVQKWRKPRRKAKKRAGKKRRAVYELLGARVSSGVGEGPVKAAERDEHRDNEGARDTIRNRDTRCLRTRMWC
jgi:hypothetical protein